MSDQWGPPGGPPPEPGLPAEWAPSPATPRFGDPAPPPPVPGPAPVVTPPAGGWEPPPAVYPQVHQDPVVGAARAPGGLRALVIGLSVLKAIPLALMLVMVALLGSLSSILSDVPEFEEFDGAITGVMVVVAVIVVLVVGIGATLLFLHIRFAVTDNLGGLAVVAGIMTLLDLVSFVGTINGDPVDPGSVVLIGAVLAAQGAVLAWALSARGS
jgi:hypothetical protein